MPAHTYALDASWRIIAADFGLELERTLRRAELPGDYLVHGPMRVSGEVYYRLFAAVEAEVDDPLFALELGSSVRTEAFNPLIFAALCSPNFLVAGRRLAQYKALIAPARLDVDERDERLSVTLEWLDTEVVKPPSYNMMELVFFVSLLRTATREEIVPLAVTVPELVEPRDAYDAFFGVEVATGRQPGFVLAKKDAHTPFLTSNPQMWEVFEPELRRRLSELDAVATTSERVRAALLEGLPAGQTTMEAIARALATSKRTLQRRLKSEGTTFQSILQRTREALAMHYLERTDLAAAEISFLLGFEEPNSFYRAFNDWTGMTPDSVRQAALP